MRRSLVMVGLLVGILATFGRTSLLAEEAGPSPATHPTVGAWVVEDESGLGLSPTFTIVFHADGTVVATDEQGITWLGAWQAEDGRRAAYTLVSLFPLESPLGPGMKNVSHIQVDEGGDRFSRTVGNTPGNRIEGTRIGLN